MKMDKLITLGFVATMAAILGVSLIVALSLLVQNAAPWWVFACVLSIALPAIGTFGLIFVDMVRPR